MAAEKELILAGAPIDRAVRLANPLRAEDAVLRTSLVVGLLRSVATNAARGLPDVALFEQGRVFLAPGSGNTLPEESVHVAGVLTGTIRRRPVEDDRPVDLYDAVDGVRTVLGALGIVGDRSVPTTRAGFSTAADVIVADRVVGAVGELSPATVTAWGLGSPAVVFELDLDLLGAMPRRDRAFVAPSPYPPAVIDLAFVLDDDVRAADVVSTLRTSGGGLMEDVYPFDEFRGPTLGPSRRSTAFRLRYRAPDRTLTDAEVRDLRGAAIEAVGRSHGGELRG
jgi:phenylalanyl-tRNA synthetase beta chain